MLFTVAFVPPALVSVPMCSLTPTLVGGVLVCPLLWDALRACPALSRFRYRVCVLYNRSPVTLC